MKKKSGLMDALREQVRVAHDDQMREERAARAALARQAKAAREQELATASARHTEARRKAEEAARKAARERQLVAHQDKALDVLERWLSEFRGKNIYVHITGKCRPLPAEVAITVGLPDSKDPDHHCFFRQEIRIRRPRSLRDVGVTFLPSQKFSSAEELDGYLRGDFLAVLAKPIARIARDVLGDFTTG